MSSSAPTEPTATGKLGATPFVELLVYALDHRLSGSLVLQTPSADKHAIIFRQGSPVKARAGGTPLGASSPLMVTLLLFARLPAETSYGYYDGVDLLERFDASGEAAGSPIATIWNVIRQAADPRRVRELLARLGDRPLRLDPRAPVNAFAAEPQAAAVVGRLRSGPLSVADLSSLGLAPAERVERVVYALALLRHLDLGGTLGPVGAESNRSGMVRPPSSASVASAASAASATSTASAAAVASAPSPAQGAELETWTTRLDGDPHVVLGVERGASADEIQSAFLRMAKRWHPDRLTDADASTRELATRIFARASEARAALLDPARRQSSARGVAVNQPNDEAQVERVLGAATSFQKAQILLKSRNLEQAELEARRALALDPEQADYMALVAWIASQKPEADLARCISDLDRALAKQPKDPVALWYRGQLRKRVGNDALAAQDFRVVVEQNPRHVDAQREVRLYEMRNEVKREGGSQGADPGDARPGILGKLFKR